MTTVRTQDELMVILKANPIIIDWAQNSWDGDRPTYSLLAGRLDADNFFTLARNMPAKDLPLVTDKYLLTVGETIHVERPVIGHYYVYEKGAYIGKVLVREYDATMGKPTLF
jgi:hypothetical protein